MDQDEYILTLIYTDKINILQYVMKAKTFLLQLQVFTNTIKQFFGFTYLVPFRGEKSILFMNKIRKIIWKYRWKKSLLKIKGSFISYQKGGWPLTLGSLIIWHFNIMFCWRLSKTSHIPLIKSNVRSPPCSQRDRVKFIY